MAFNPSVQLKTSIYEGLILKGSALFDSLYHWGNKQKR